MKPKVFRKMRKSNEYKEISGKKALGGDRESEHDGADPKGSRHDR